MEKNIKKIVGIILALSVAATLVIIPASAVGETDDATNTPESSIENTTQQDPDPNSREEVIQAADKVLNYISNKRKVLKGYFTKQQLKSLVSNVSDLKQIKTDANESLLLVVGLNKSSTIDEINKIESDAKIIIQTVSKKAKKVKAKKKTVLKQVKKKYKRNKDYLSSKQIKRWKKYRKNIANAKTIKAITKNYKKICNITKKVKKHRLFVEKGTKRIDSYLAGSPTSGCGKYYAEAAGKYNIDPKGAPAISCVESGKGAAYIHGTYNIGGWGCGSITLGSSWKESIFNYVRQLKAGYGYTLTMHAACKYCASYWYGLCSSEMAKI